MKHFINCVPKTGRKKFNRKIFILRSHYIGCAGKFRNAKIAVVYACASGESAIPLPVIGQAPMPARLWQPLENAVVSHQKELANTILLSQDTLLL
jgi:hypothetical protein